MGAKLSLMGQPNAIADNVSDIRKKRSLSIDQLAEQAGMAPSTLQRKLNGGTLFAPHELIAIARVLGVDADEFLVGAA